MPPRSVGYNVKQDNRVSVCRHCVSVCIEGRGTEWTRGGLNKLRPKGSFLKQTVRLLCVLFLARPVFFQTWVTLTDKVNLSSLVAMVAVVARSEMLWWWTVYDFSFLCWGHHNCWWPCHEQDKRSTDWSRTQMNLKLYGNVVTSVFYGRKRVNIKVYNSWKCHEYTLTPLDTI